MTAIVMDGKAVAAKVRAEVAVRAKEFAGKMRPETDPLWEISAGSG